MTLKVRLAAMMVLILVAVLALQYLLMERERRQLLSRLTEMSHEMDRTTAVFVERVRDASVGPLEPGSPGSGQFAAWLTELTALPSLEVAEDASITIVAWADSSHSHGFFEESHLRVAMHSRIDSLSEWTAQDSLDRWIASSAHGAELSSKNFLLPAPEDLRSGIEARRVRGEGVDSLVVVAKGAPDRVVVRSFESANGVVKTDTMSGPEALRAISETRRAVLPRASMRETDAKRATEMIINLPVGGGPADSFYSVQVRYPLDSLTEELERSRKSGFLWLGAVLGVGILGAVLVAGQFTRPIRALQTSFGRVVSGDLDATVKPERPDEIGQLTASFNDMVEQLRESKEVESRLVEAERLAAVGRLAAGVAHEVRNPLNTILLSMQQMRDKPDANFDRYYEIVTGEIERLETMVSAFLDLSKSGELARERVDVVTQIDHALQLFEPEASLKRVRFARSGEGQVHLCVDPQRLPMVWNNLLANALGAAPEESVVEVRVETIEIEELPEPVRDSLRDPTRGRSDDLQREARGEPTGKPTGEPTGEPRTERERALRVTFTDQGPGVPEELRDRVWDPFFSARKDGTGLGLSIVRSVVERHGGAVRIVGDNGSCFEVVLPMEEERP